MSRITFITGGSRSGKSSYAVKIAQKYKKVVFVATCQGRDSEMRARIRLHQSARPAHWKTIEEPLDLACAAEKIPGGIECILIDCLTLYVSNALLSGKKEEMILADIGSLLSVLKKKKARVLIVSNEVGLGIVPAHKLARDFRDAAGRVNQKVACAADEAYCMVSGIPLKLK